MFVSPQNSCVEILTFCVTILRGGGFWRYSAHEGRDLVNGINPLQETLLFSVGGYEEMAICTPGSGLLPDTRSGTLLSTSQPPELCEKERLLTPPSLWPSVRAAGTH